MLTDPQIVTVATVAKSMPRISTGTNNSVYQMADESYKLTLSHQKSAGKIRSLCRIDFRAVVADPLTAVNDFETLTCFTVIERPLVGFTATQVKDLVAGFQNWLNAAMVDKVYGQET